MVTEDQVTEVINFLASQGSIVIIWSYEDILNEIAEVEELWGIVLDTAQKQQVVKLVQESPEWESLMNVDAWQYNLIYSTIVDALEELGIRN